MCVRECVQLLQRRQINCTTVALKGIALEITSARSLCVSSLV